MSSNTTDTAPGKASTDAPPSGRARSRRLITALTILAVLAIGSVALYAISLIVTLAEAVRSFFAPKRVVVSPV